MQTIPLLRPDAVLHLAALDQGGRVRDGPRVCHSCQRARAQHVALAARACGASILHVSTDYVFDGMKGAPVRRDGHAASPLRVRADEARRGAVRAGAGTGALHRADELRVRRRGRLRQRRRRTAPQGRERRVASATGSDRRRSSGHLATGCCRCCSPAVSAPITWPGPSPPAGSTSWSAPVTMGGLPGTVDAQAFASLGLVAPRPANSASRAPTSSTSGSSRFPALDEAVAEWLRLGVGGGRRLSGRRPAGCYADLRRWPRPPTTTPRSTTSPASSTGPRSALARPDGHRPRSATGSTISRCSSVPTRRSSSRRARATWRRTSRWRRQLKYGMFRVARPISWRYDRLLADHAELTTSLAERVMALEAEVARLRAQDEAAEPDTIAADTDRDRHEGRRPPSADRVRPRRRRDACRGAGPARFERPDTTRTSCRSPASGTRHRSSRTRWRCGGASTSPSRTA